MSEDELRDLANYYHGTSDIIESINLPELSLKEVIKFIEKFEDRVTIIQ